MIGTITKECKERVAGSSWKSAPYLEIAFGDTAKITLPRIDFPFKCRKIGDRVEVRYVQVGNGHRYIPFEVRD